MRLHQLFPIDGTQSVGFCMIDPAEEAGVPPAGGGHTSACSTKETGPAGGDRGDTPPADPALRS